MPKRGPHLLIDTAVGPDRWLEPTGLVGDLASGQLPVMFPRSYPWPGAGVDTTTASHDGSIITIRDGETPTLDPTGVTLSIPSGFGGSIFKGTAGHWWAATGNGRAFQRWDGASWTRFPALGTYTHRAETGADGSVPGRLAGGGTGGNDRAWSLDLASGVQTTWSAVTSAGGPLVSGAYAGYARFTNAGGGVVACLAGKTYPTATEASRLGVWTFSASTGATISGPHRFGYSGWGSTATPGVVTYPRPASMWRDQSGTFWLVMQVGATQYEAITFNPATMIQTGGPATFTSGSSWPGPWLGPAPEGGIYVGHPIGGAGIYAIG